MTSSADQRVKVKLFVGLLVSSEVRMHLNQSQQWQQDQVVRSSDGRELELLRYQDKEYVGTVLDQEMLPLSQLRKQESWAREALERYCPELGVDNMKVYVFPQVFLS